MRKKLHGILAEILDMNLSEINDVTGVDNCENWDSISLLMIVSGVEEAFEISFEPEEIESITNVHIIATLINKKSASLPG
tara:strand:+ start:5273 stop:5512 length:240 start_codon:yes stop_codon:yes gene_type:complete